MVGSIWRLRKIPSENQFFAVMQRSLKLHVDATHWIEIEWKETDLLYPLLNKVGKKWQLSALLLY